MIKQSSISKVIQGKESFIESVKGLKSQNFAKIFPDIQQKIDLLIKDIEALKINGSEKKHLEGEILTKESALELVVNATGNKRWSFTSNSLDDEGYSYKFKEIKEYFNVEFDESEVKVYTFFRNVRDRSALYHIEMIVLPGCLHLELATDRVQYSMEGLGNKDEVFKFLDRESN